MTGKREETGADKRVMPDPALARTEDPGPLWAAHTPNFPALLRRLGASLLVTTFVTVSGGGLSRVFQVDGLVTASISGLPVSGGSAGSGGGLYNQGTLALTNCTVSGNSATGNGGGLDNTSLGSTTLTNTNVKNNSASVGGGIANQGTLTVASSNISNNRRRPRGVASARPAAARRSPIPSSTPTRSTQRAPPWAAGSTVKTAPCR
jgi:hypothetical protein